jgi:hypothetical protein
MFAAGRKGLLIAVLAAGAGHAEDTSAWDQARWERAEKQAEREMRRLPPSDFTQLPPEVTRELARRGCMVPQSFSFLGEETKPHNVIRGSFAKKGQTDWAVLCSTGGASSIRIFWGGSPRCPDMLAPEADKAYLQNFGDGKIGYSRKISAAGKDVIQECFRAYGGPKPPPIRHQGIEDSFVMKASIIHYCHQGKWLQLTGAD